MAVGGDGDGGAAAAADGAARGRRYARVASTAAAAAASPGDGSGVAVARVVAAARGGTGCALRRGLGERRGGWGRTALGEPHGEQQGSRGGCGGDATSCSGRVSSREQQIGPASKCGADAVVFAQGLSAAAATGRRAAGRCDESHQCASAQDWIVGTRAAPEAACQAAPSNSAARACCWAATRTAAGAGACAEGGG